MNFTCELRRIVDDTYDIQIGHSLMSDLVSDLKSGLTGKKNFVIITDSNVKPLYADRIFADINAAGFKAALITIEAGEKSKTRAVKAQIEDEMLRLGYRRDCAVIAVGGGVVTDISGFVAGTYGRGVPFVNYATTLLAAADASIGGKTAVDTPLATNLIGIFNQPKKVYIDIDTWETLPSREISGGLAETIKHGCLGDRELFEYLEENTDKIFSCDREACEYISRHNCEVKYNVVMQDERESGLREVLNLGHTVGRAIETVSDYRLHHGEAVAIGLTAQALLGQTFGYVSESDVNRLTALLRKAELPTAIPDYIDREALLRKLYTDKKVRDGKLRFVFQKGIGEVVKFGENNFAREISEPEIAAVLEKM